MGSYDKIKKYSDKVCEQIRWKKVRPMIAHEIENHLCDQRDDYVSNGEEENSATEQAIVQMGDAVFVGQELDKAHKPKPQWLMIALTSIFMLTGVFIHMNAGVSADDFKTIPILSYVFAFGLFLFCYYIDFTVFGRHAIFVYFFVLLLSIIGISFGSQVNGRAVWIYLPFSISLHYFSLIFPLVFALLIYSLRNKGYAGIIWSGIGYVPFAMVLNEVPTQMGIIFYTIVAFTILCYAIWRGWFGISKKQGYLLVSVPFFTIMLLKIIIIISKQSYIISRLRSFLSPDYKVRGEGYIYGTILDILSESVFIGKGGIPNSLPDITKLPAVDTDYLLIYLIHEIGYIALFFLVLILLLFAVFGFYKAVKQKSVLGSLISVAIMGIFLLQAVMNIFGTLVYGSALSMSIPFVSYGNSALFINAALIGFMLSVFRTGDSYRDGALYPVKQKSLICYKDGKLIIDLNKLVATK